MHILGPPTCAERPEEPACPLTGDAPAWQVLSVQVLVCTLVFVTVQSASRKSWIYSIFNVNNAECLGFPNLIWVPDCFV